MTCKSREVSHRVRVGEVDISAFSKTQLTCTRTITNTYIPDLKSVYVMPEHHVLAIIRTSDAIASIALPKLT
jgi:hypothetical protein